MTDTTAPDFITDEEMSALEQTGRGPGPPQFMPEEPTTEKPGFWDRSGIPAAIRSVFTGYGLMNQVPGALADLKQQDKDPFMEWAGQMGHGLLESMKQGADRASVEHVNESLPARVAHTMVGATPVVGPMVEAVGEDLRSGNWKGLAGTITGALAPAAMGPVADALKLSESAKLGADMATGPQRAMAQRIGLKPTRAVEPFNGVATDRPLSQKISPFSPSDAAWVAKNGITEANPLLRSIGAPEVGPEVTSTKDVAKSISEALNAPRKGYRPGGFEDTDLRRIVGEAPPNPTDVGNVVSKAVARSQARVRGDVGPRLEQGRAAAETVPIDRELAAGALSRAPEANVPAVRRAQSNIIGDPEMEGADAATTFGEADRAASDLSTSRAGKLAGEDLSKTLRNSLRQQDPAAARKLMSAEEEARTRLTPYQKGGPAQVLAKADRFMPEKALGEDLANTTRWEQTMKSIGNDDRALRATREHVAHNVMGLGEDLNTFKANWRKTPEATKKAIFGEDAAAVNSVLDTIDKLAADNTGKLQALQKVLDQYSPTGWGRRLVTKGGAAAAGFGTGAYLGGPHMAVQGALITGMGSILADVISRPGAMLRVAKGFEDFARLGRPQGLINVISAAQRQQNKGKKTQ